VAATDRTTSPEVPAEGTPVAGDEVVRLTPRQRWGTCCPNDPACEHSFMDDAALARYMDTPLEVIVMHPDDTPPNLTDRF
jgi:hypothetical protein